MSFGSPRPLAARWRAVGADGLEHLDLRPGEGTIVVDSVVIGGRGGVPYGVRYRLVCGEDWVTRSLDITTTDGRSLRLRSDGEGEWTDGEGWPVSHLDGCIDVDLAGSPFTNTLPIRRVDLVAGGEPAELNMAYVPFDTFKPVVDRQIYRCLEQDRLYRYEAADRSFTADLAVDDDGLVTDYPGLFAKIEL
ncbi:MAG TPA: putative glycolipid-binding domain-containing protein [Bauldia sp.]|nr:putative glycolipid-binding domain-containing protein [Bauldia sp.]